MLAGFLAVFEAIAVAVQLEDVDVMGRWQGSSYRESDWKFYKNLRDTDPDTDPRESTRKPWVSAN